MTTKRKTTVTKRGLTAKEKDSLFLMVSKARVKAYKMSQNDKLNAETRRRLRTMESRLWKATNDF